MDEITEPIKILSIDGGGIRGIIPAMILAEIEKRTEYPISSMFNLISGTSTGGIIALGLTCSNEKREPKYSASDIVTFYENKGPQIFNRTLLRKIMALGNLIDEKYSAKSFEQILLEFFGDTRLCEANPNVIIPAYEIERRIPWFFKSSKAKVVNKYDFFMRDVARATAAAPTYFEPSKIETNDLADYYSFIDGGVFANNPTMNAYVEAKSLYPNAKNFFVVSLGTGEFTKPLDYKKAKNWGVSGWAVPLLSVTYHGISSSVDYEMENLLPDIQNNDYYYRLQPKLNKFNDVMDDASEDNIRNLILLSEELIRKENTTISKICDQLVKWRKKIYHSYV